MFRTITFALIAALGLSAAAQAGDCTGNVVGVRPISQYNHAAGNGFLAMRTGPGSRYQQISELYLGDEISVWGRNGNWYQVSCMSGRCTNPLWGQPSANGWVYGKYISIGGVCP
ncbi:SH3 domain-containing protein [Tropicibacter naphthalenivorans]|uniref:Bacterial SH3 domain protein n=1 Tax=Tropicibacter naphthalenivorans TaxID=441103 RepID=A0A0P1GG88_9RHOB|nr:SH3 domain-containing protein [Tropicibacter naphthalenivorans]CUH75231.1 Bacterial SH3 domain protein [Tropicibacter naphthalenivorans]SMC45444.1 SH3 domain-containing protein [Tropicibacter naphthalenivorans]